MFLRTLGSSFTYIMLISFCMQSSQPMATAFIMAPGAICSTTLFFCSGYTYNLIYFYLMFIKLVCNWNKCFKLSVIMDNFAVTHCQLYNLKKLHVTESLFVNLHKFVDTSSRRLRMFFPDNWIFMNAPSLVKCSGIRLTDKFDLSHLDKWDPVLK